MKISSSFKNILICDDHSFIRIGIESCLREAVSEETTIYKASNGKEAIELVRKNKIDLVLLDLNLPDIGGPEVIDEVKKISSFFKIIVITSCDQAEILLRVKNKNVEGIIQKSTSSDHLRACMAHISRGEVKTYLDPFITQIIGNHEIIEFTGKESEVLNGIIEGQTNQEIANKLGIALSTVRFHRANIMSKTGMRNAAELTAWYLSGKEKKARFII